MEIQKKNEKKFQFLAPSTFLSLSLSPTSECSKNKIIKVENSLSGLKKKQQEEEQ